MFEKYHHYFNIDPEYFPAVNEKVINENPDLWKKYYPHETFVKLIKDTISVLSRKQKVSIWGNTAYIPFFKMGYRKTPGKNAESIDLCSIFVTKTH